MPASDPAPGWRRIAAVAVPLLVPAVLAAMPPADGAMLVTPLSGATTGETLRWLHDRGLPVVGGGPLPGSLIVRGTRADILSLSLAHGAIVTASRPGGCFGKAPS